MIALAMTPAAAKGQIMVDNVSAYTGTIQKKRPRAYLNMQVFGRSGRSEDRTASLVADLRRTGMHRVLPGREMPGSPLSASQGPYAMGASCRVSEWAPEGERVTHFSMLAEVQFLMNGVMVNKILDNWILVKELHKSVQQGQTDSLDRDLYVEGCSNTISDVLLRLGFDKPE
jgi:hypothetical protein